MENAERCFQFSVPRSHHAMPSLSSDACFHLADLHKWLMVSEYYPHGRQGRSVVSLMRRTHGDSNEGRSLRDPGVEYHAKVSGFVIRRYSRVMFAKDQVIRFFLFTSFFLTFLFFLSYNLRLLHLWTEIKKFYHLSVFESLAIFTNKIIVI